MQRLHRAFGVLLVFFYRKMQQLSRLDEDCPSRLPQQEVVLRSVSAFGECSHNSNSISCRRLLVVSRLLHLLLLLSPLPKIQEKTPRQRGYQTKAKTGWSTGPPLSKAKRKGSKEKWNSQEVWPSSWWFVWISANRRFLNIVFWTILMLVVLIKCFNVLPDFFSIKSCYPTAKRGTLSTLKSLISIFFFFSQFCMEWYWLKCRQDVIFEQWSILIPIFTNC